MSCIYSVSPFSPPYGRHADQLTYDLVLLYSGVLDAAIGEEIDGLLMAHATRT